MTYSAIGLLAAGFERAGIRKDTPDIKPGGSASRTFEITMLYAGEVYLALQPATYTLSKDSKSATLGLPKK